MEIFMAMREHLGSGILQNAESMFFVKRAEFRAPIKTISGG